MRACCAFSRAVCWEWTGQLIQSIRHEVRTTETLCPDQVRLNRQFGLFLIAELNNQLNSKFPTDRTPPPGRPHEPCVQLGGVRRSSGHDLAPRDRKRMR